MKRVLDMVRVVDLSRHISGPYCSSLLADMGAEVIRLELPGGDEDRHFGYLSPRGDSYAFINRMRNKKAITLNLNHSKGKEIFKRLVESSDVVLENFALRDKEKFDLNFDSLRKINPSIILASISAFGSTGPNAYRIGFDPIAQAVSGAMSFNGFPGNPPTRTAAAWMATTPAFLSTRTGAGGRRRGRPTISTCPSGSAGRMPGTSRSKPLRSCTCGLVQRSDHRPTVPRRRAGRNGADRQERPNSSR